MFAVRLPSLSEQCLRNLGSIQLEHCQSLYMPSRIFTEWVGGEDFSSHTSYPPGSETYHYRHILVAKMSHMAPPGCKRA